MANEQNLKSFKDYTAKEQREIAKKGGIASGEARRKRRTLKEELLAMLEDKDIQESITLALISKAKTGDTKAYEVIRDTVGEKPVDKIEAEVKETTINISLDDE